MEEDLNFIEKFLLHLEKSSDEGFSYSIPFNSKDRYLMLHISSLDIANLVFSISFKKMTWPSFL